MNVTRRDVLHAGVLAGVSSLFPGQAASGKQAASASTASVRWIDGAAPKMHLGQTFGVAWPRGNLRSNQHLGVRDSNGRIVPSQHWTLATWPDGSVKWTAHALSPEERSESYTVAPGRAEPPSIRVKVSENDDSVVINTGGCEWIVPKRGDTLITRASVQQGEVISGVELVALAKTGTDGEVTSYLGRIERVTVEQAGPIRAVVRIEGMHVSSARAWLPFTVRLYAYCGATHLRVVHSFVFDGDPAQDFICGLGVRARVPLQARTYDRHVRFALNSDKLFAEAVRPLTGLRSAVDPGENFRAAQVAGQATPPFEQMAPKLRGMIDRVPEWADFTLSQLSAHGFSLVKRTRKGHAWIDADAGTRAPGLAYVGQPTGGAALAIRYFRERFPTQLDVRDADQSQATLTGWLWSPNASAMDLRPYHDGLGMTTYEAQNEGLAVTYEDYEPGWDSAHGIARTSELTLWACDATPSSADLREMAQANSFPAQLMTAPAHLHAAGVFGDWSLPDRSTPVRAAIEDQLDRLSDFYIDEVERRSWLGFWNHGDVMHTYDPDRHQWRYDIGGFAWDNSELSTDLWLWYAALRSGDARTFRFAEAMTRHTGEVDVYHLGRFAGLGTRHGVQHWSDSSKQPRISTATYRRIFYYLTADERTGDLMRALLDSERVLEDVIIERKVPGSKRPALQKGQVQISFGTVWCNLAAAWLTEWERTGERRWRDRLISGMDSIGRLSHGWLHGSGTFDLASGRFITADPAIDISHLNAVFGAVEINAELIQLLSVPRYRAAWLNYCRWYNAPRDEFAAQFGTPGGGRGLREGHSRLTAYAAREEHDPALGARAATEFAEGKAGLGLWLKDPRRELPGGIVEWPELTTNTAAQWALAAIQTLALIPQALDRVEYTKHS